MLNNAEIHYDAYDYLDWILAALYMIILVFSLHGLGKTICGANADPLFPKEQSKRRSGKRTFYFIATLLVLARCSFFVIRPLWIHDLVLSNGNKISSSWFFDLFYFYFYFYFIIILFLFFEIGAAEIWANVGALLCVIAYAVLLIFFAGFYYDVDGDRSRVIWKKVKTPGIILLMLISGLVGAYICAVMIYRDSKKIEDLDMYFACTMIGLSLIMSSGFLYYGIMIWKVVARYRLLSESRMIHAKRVSWRNIKKKKKKEKKNEN
jgi:hypothetical protein